MGPVNDEIVRRRLEASQDEGRTLMTKLTKTRDELGAIRRQFDFESREIHPMETMCAWGEDHPLGAVFYGLGDHRALVCQACWEEVHGHEVTSGS